MDAFSLLCRTEGIIPAIESAHAVAGRGEAWG
jgi:tryptophan synthase beta chain